jgi:hypothetical protein
MRRDSRPRAPEPARHTPICLSLASSLRLRSLLELGLDTVVLALEAANDPMVSPHVTH